MAHEPETLQEAIQYFTDQDNCLNYVVVRRWPNGVTCPTCGSSEARFLSTRRLWECKGKHPKRQFSVKVGTIFEDSPIGLDKWLTAMWLLVNCKNGISSYEIARDLGISQKSAWHMEHRIRLTAQDPETGGKLGGEVEVDETFIGGKARFMHADRNRKRRGYLRKAPGPWGKTIVAAVLERGGKVRPKVVDRRKKRDMHDFVKANVEPGSALYTDDLKSYDGLDKEYLHGVIDHAEKHVDGQVHTNGLENFWSLLKRGLKGTYVSVEPFHLFRYLDEQAFRYNNRKLTDAERFSMAVSGIVGKRVTWNQVTGKQNDNRAPVN